MSDSILATSDRRMVGGGADAPADSSASLAEDTTVVKDEHGQDITCVVCNDKSSGKHYGQYTCEGKYKVYST